MERYLDAFKDFSTIYRYPHRCYRHAQLISSRVGVFCCALCRKGNSFFPIEIKWLFSAEDPRFRLYMTPSLTPEHALDLPNICRECMTQLTEVQKGLNRIVNPAWKQVVANHVPIPGLVEILYDYIFPETYCPCCCLVV